MKKTNTKNLDLKKKAISSLSGAQIQHIKGGKMYFSRRSMGTRPLVLS